MLLFALLAACQESDSSKSQRAWEAAEPERLKNRQEFRDWQEQQFTRREEEMRRAPVRRAPPDHQRIPATPELIRANARAGGCEEECLAEGLCVRDRVRCIAVYDEHCAQSKACAENGTCKARHDKCL